MTAFSQAKLIFARAAFGLLREFSEQQGAIAASLLFLAADLFQLLAVLIILWGGAGRSRS